MATQNKCHAKVAADSTEVPISDNSWDQDNKNMARMGKKQEFKRNFGWISSVCFTSCTMDKFMTPSPQVASMLTDTFYAPDMSPASLSHSQRY